MANADRAAGRPAASRHRTGPSRCRAVRDRGDSARRAFRGRACRMAAARGYICENFGALLRLPDLGPIGSNGLANPRDFLTPHAAYEDREGDFELVAKYERHSVARGHRSIRRSTWSPGTATTRRTNTTCAVSTPSARSAFDHPDPSIFLVLQSQTDTPGVDTIDFVIFPPRWLAPKIRSARPGSTATSRANSWASCMACTTRRPRASCRAARACTTACRATGRTRTPSRRHRREPGQAGLRQRHDGPGPAATKTLPGKDFQQEVFVPAATAAFHGDAVVAGMLLQERQREAVEPGEVLPQMFHPRIRDSSSRYVISRIQWQLFSIAPMTPDRSGESLHAHRQAADVVADLDRLLAVCDAATSPCRSTSSPSTVVPPGQVLGDRQLDVSPRLLPPWPVSVSQCCRRASMPAKSPSSCSSM